MAIFSGKRYFSDILWTQACNNNILFGRQLYFHCPLKYMVICAFENPSSIPSFLATQIVYIGYGDHIFERTMKIELSPIP
jgi:hypothetical protein